MVDGFVTQTQHANLRIVCQPQRCRARQAARRAAHRADLEGRRTGSHSRVRLGLTLLLPASVHDRMRTAHRTQHGQAAQPISFPSKAGAPISQLPRIRSRSPADSVTRKQALLLASGRAQPGCARRAQLLPGGQSCCSWLQTWRVNGEVGWDEAQGRKADGGGVKVGLLCSAGSRGNWFPTVLSRGFPAGCDLRTFRSFSEAQRPQTKLLTELLTARVVKCTNSLVFRINGRAHPVSKAILPHASAFSLLQQPTGVAE